MPFFIFQQLYFMSLSSSSESLSWSSFFSIYFEFRSASLCDGASPARPATVSPSTLSTRQAASPSRLAKIYSSASHAASPACSASFSPTTSTPHFLMRVSCSSCNGIPFSLFFFWANHAQKAPLACPLPLQIVISINNSWLKNLFHSSFNISSSW